MIHTDKVEELAEIKERDKEDSYIYKKVSSSVRDIKERIETIEKQIAGNKKLVSEEFIAVEEKRMKEKEKKWLARRAEERAEAKAAAEAAAAAAAEKAQKIKSEEEPTKPADTDESKNELAKDPSSSSIVSSASNIEATAETVAKLPKIPKLSAKRPAEDSADSGESKAKVAKESSKDDTSSKSSSAKTSSSKSSKNESSTSSKSSRSDSKDEKSKSSSNSSSRSGPITEEEIDRLLPYYQFCSLCKNFFESTDEFISHLHRDAHLNGLRTSDFGIIKRAEEKLDTQYLKEENKPQSNSEVNGTSNDQSTSNDALNSHEIFGNEHLLINFTSNALFINL